MKEVIATKLLVYSMPFATKDLASVLTRTRSRLTSEDGYCLDYDFLENDPSTYVCGALANLPNLDHINVDDDSERLDVWYYSRFMHTNGMGKIFSNWSTLSDRFLSEQRIENAFLTVGFVSEFDDLELTYRSVGDSAAVYDIDLNPGDRFIDEHEELSCEYLNRLLGFLSAISLDRSEFVVDPSKKRLEFRADPNSSITRVDAQERWAFPVRRSESASAAQALMAYIRSVDSYCRLGCRWSLTKEQWKRIALDAGLPSGHYAFRIDGMLTSEARDILLVGRDAFHGFLPVMRYQVIDAIPRFELNIGVICEGDRSCMVLSAGDVDNDIYEEEKVLLKRFASIIPGKH